MMYTASLLGELLLQNLLSPAVTKFAELSPAKFSIVMVLYMLL